MPHVFAYDHRHDLPLTELALVIGGKAANIATMATELGLPVPPAFTITTAACNAYLASGWPAGLDDEIREHMARLETLVGRRFGDPADPLLVSVRSGAPRSMPGMMDTILNLGLNRRHGGRPGGSLRRSRVRARLPRPLPQDLPRRRGRARGARSTHGTSCAARSRRSSGPGTATAPGPTASTRGSATAWAPASRSRPWCSATGARTPARASCSPATRRPARTPSTATSCSTPRARTSWPGRTRRSPSRAWTTACRSVAAELRRYATDPGAALPRLLRHRVHHRAGPPVDAPGSRRQADPAGRAPDGPGHGRGPGLPAHPRGGRAPRRTRSSPTRRRPSPSGSDAGPVLATGLPASPGVACGEICLTPEAAVAAADAGRDAILVRAETSPDDVHGMSRSARDPHHDRGLREPRGGGRPGLGHPRRRRGVRRAPSATAAVTIGGRHPAGRRGHHDRRRDRRGLRGRRGRRRRGRARRRGSCWAGRGSWASSRRAAPVEAPAGPAGPAAAPRRPPWRCRPGRRGPRRSPSRATATRPGWPARLAATPDDAAALLDLLVAEGLAELAAGSFRLTADGKAVGAERLAADGAAWGVETTRTPRSTRSSRSTTG